MRPPCRGPSAPDWRAIDLQPRDTWAWHAVTHVHEMRNAPKDGIAWLEPKKYDICFYALANIEKVELHAGSHVAEVAWFNIRKIPKMVFDHNKILDSCFKHLQHKVQHEPIGFNLLPKKFTLLQLQELYEAILDQKLDKPNFRRKLIKMNLLVPCDEKQTAVSHRAAQLYRFDKKVYNQLIDKGFSFEI